MASTPNPEDMDIPTISPQLVANAQNFSLAQHMRRVYLLTAREGVTSAMLERPEFWTHVAQQLRQGDHVEVWAHDNTWYAEVLITYAESSHVMATVINRVSIDKSVPLEDADFVVKYGNMHTHWVVRRKADGKDIRQGLATRDEANMWLAQHLKTIRKSQQGRAA